MMSLDYYNRSLSGWEPMVEPWRLDAMWSGSPVTDQEDLNIKITCKYICTKTIHHVNIIIHVTHSKLLEANIRWKKQASVFSVI